MVRGKGREDRGAASSGGRGTNPSSAILDAAFRRAYKATPHGEGRIDRARRRAQLKIVRSAAVSVRHLRLATKPFHAPGLTEFERRLVTNEFGADTFGRALSRLAHAESRIRGLSQEEQRTLAKAGTTDEFGASVRRFYGRLASHLREVDPDLVTVREVRAYLRRRPQLTDLQPVVVIAGFPNVGKSSLVAALSTARPRISDHPFTTLAIGVGHADLGFDRLQILDTPGVLDRKSKGNRAEVEAETAVAHVATVVVFVLDPSERCGYPMADQEQLLARWHSELPSIPIVEVETKADLVRTGSSRLAVSAETGEGLDRLRDELQRGLAEWRPPATGEEVREESYSPEEYGEPDRGTEAREERGPM